MNIKKPNLDELKSINKDLSKIPVFSISFFDKPGQNDPQLKTIIRQIDETGPCENFLKENDLILKVNKKKIKTVQDFTNVQKKLIRFCLLEKRSMVMGLQQKVTLFFNI